MSDSGSPQGSRATILNLAIYLLSFIAAIELAAAPFRPGPLAATSSGDVIVLNLERELLRLRLTTEVNSLWRVRPIEEAVDMAVARLDGTESIFVTMSPKFFGRSPRVVRFSLSGQANGEWTLPPWKGNFSGIAIDTSEQLAYVVNGETCEIYSVDLRTVGSSPVRRFKVRSAEVLSALVFDTKRRRLLVADPIEGVIYAVQIDSGEVSELARRTGEPLALVLDPWRDRLFIADNINQRILVISLSSKAAEAEVFSAIKQIKEPMGLAVGAEGVLWVADYGAGAVFLLSREGNLLETIRW